MGIRRTPPLRRHHMPPLLSVSEAFRVYNDDKGWARVDFGLLGTSMGWMIPRRSSEIGNVLQLGKNFGVFREEGKVRPGKQERRVKRRERKMIQMEKFRKAVRCLVEGEDERKRCGGGDFVEKKRDLGDDEDMERFVDLFPGRVTQLDKMKRRGI